MNQHLRTAIEVTAQIITDDEKSGAEFKQKVELVTGLNLKNNNSDTRFVKKVAAFITQGYPGELAVKLADEENAE